MTGLSSKFPNGCTITNIIQEEGARSGLIYARLVGPDGQIIISATLEYIYERLVESGIENKKDGGTL